jgi:uncharacterized protein YjbI with pentapeptide repeats
MYYEQAEDAKSGEPDTKEVEALAAALNHSAERAQTLWFSFLTFMLYLAIATGTTTHRMLFLEEPLNLPVLNIKLPLLGFYILTPVIFVTFHFYMLLNLVLLARTAKSFEDALARAFSKKDDESARENFRMRIENTIFVQLLVGAKPEREGCNARLLSAMALITLALAPIALLLMIQIKFLPYHSEWIIWWHRFLLLADLVLVWTLWPGYRRQDGERLWPKRSWWLVPAGAFSATALAYAVMVATFPDEHMYLATNWLRESDVSSKLRDRFRPVNTLDLHGEDLIDGEKLARIEKTESSVDAQKWEHTLSVAGRDLTEANLRSTDVRHIDFSSAILNRADLSLAWAGKARFGDAKFRGAWLDGARLQGAELERAQLQGASLVRAHLQGSSLRRAQLQGASLKGAHLQGAVLEFAQLQGASLSGAAGEESLKLKHAHFAEQPIRPPGFEFLSAEFEGAQLQGMSLVGTQLQGASLNGVRLQGAILLSAQLQGATLDEADLKGTLLSDVCTWRADARYAVWYDTIASPHTGAKDDSPNWHHDCTWTATSFEELKTLITKLVPEGDLRRAATERIEKTLDPAKTLDGEDEMAKDWADHERSSATDKVFEKKLAEQWRSTGCAEEGAPYVLRQIIAAVNTRITDWFGEVAGVNLFGAASPEVVPKLAAAFLAPDCAGARGLSEAEIAKLKAIAATAAPQAPKP